MRSFLVFQQEVELRLRRQRIQDLRRRELLHKRWSEAVWTPIQRGVEQHMAQAAGQETRRLRAMLLHYIHHCNAKVGPLMNPVAQVVTSLILSRPAAAPMSN